MRTYTYTVTVTCEDTAQARRVMAERLGCDDDYGFDYQVDYERVADKHGNRLAEEGCTRCTCGCKYWQNDVCIDCGMDADVVTTLSVDDAAILADLLGEWA